MFARIAVVTLFALTTTIFSAQAPTFGTTVARPHLGIAINEDNSHFFMTRTAQDMTRSGLEAWVDQYADTQVSHLFLCPNAMRASFKSATRDAIWELGDQQMPSGAGKRWMDNARTLYERGLDPYAIWIARCRQRGISPWLSMRMNDVHDVSNRKSFMHSTFWLSHPQYWRVPGSMSGWLDRALDYGVADVRQHNMRFVRELLTRYDPDGIELDWMRFGWHFKPDGTAAGRATLTQFMRDVRKLANAESRRRGHPIRVGARVPTDPDAAAGLGMDGVTWAREGLVDMLVPTPFFTTSDFDIPMELWRKRIGPAVAKVVLAAGLEYNLRAAPGLPAVPNDLASVRGFIVASLHRGADQIYLFNFMDSDTIPVSKNDYRTLLKEGADLRVALRKPRRHVVTFRDTVPPGFPNGAVLPAAAARGTRFHIYTGPVPTRGKVCFVAGLAKRPGLAKASFAVRLNGTPCRAIDDNNNPHRLPGVERAVQFACPLPALQEGYNDVSIRQVPDQAGQQIVWAELQITP